MPNRAGQSVASRAPAAAGALCAFALSGCAATTDSARDLQRVETLIESRETHRPAYAAPTGTTQAPWDGLSPLDENTAVALALDHNLDLRADLELIAAARADLAQSGLLPNPVLLFTISAPLQGDTVTPFAITALQQLTALWLRPGRMSAAEARLNQRILDVSDRALRLAADVRTLHARLVATQERASLLRALAEARATRCELLSRLLSAGEATEIEAAEALAATAIARTAAIESATEADALKRTLLEQIGRADAGADWLAIRDRHSAPAAADIDEDSAIQLALSQRLDVAAARAALDAANEELELAGLAPIPDVSLGVNYFREMSGDSAIGPVLEVTPGIFDDGSARQAGAAAAAKRAAFVAQAVAQRAVREARVAWRQTAGARAVFAEIEDRAVAPRRAILEKTRQLAAAGEASRLDVLSAETEALSADVERVRAELALRVALVELERSAGGALPAP